MHLTRNTRQLQPKTTVNTRQSTPNHKQLYHHEIHFTIKSNTRQKTAGNIQLLKLINIQRDNKQTFHLSIEIIGRTEVVTVTNWKPRTPWADNAIIFTSFSAIVRNYRQHIGLRQRWQCSFCVRPTMLIDKFIVDSWLCPLCPALDSVWLESKFLTYSAQYKIRLYEGNHMYCISKLNVDLFSNFSIDPWVLDFSNPDNFCYCPGIANCATVRIIKWKIVQFYYINIYKTVCM